MTGAGFRALVGGKAVGELLRLGEPLSLWGGLDPETGSDHRPQPPSARAERDRHDPRHAARTWLQLIFVGAGGGPAARDGAGRLRARLARLDTGDWVSGRQASLRDGLPDRVRCAAGGFDRAMDDRPESRRSLCWAIDSLLNGHVCRNRADLPMDNRMNGFDELKSFFKRMPVAFYRTSTTGELIAANPALANILGYDSVEEMMALAAHGRDHLHGSGPACRLAAADRNRRRDSRLRRPAIPS